MQLKDKIAVVTGGTAGIGRGIAKKLAQEGAKVMVVGRNAERGQEVVKEIGNGAEFHKVDVANTQAVDQFFQKVLADHGKVDILVNNAGITRDALLMRLSEEHWDEVIDTNLKSAYNTCRAVIRSMMKARSGKIINISSIVGLTGNPGQAHYSASKAGLIGLSKSLAREVASRGICVNCVAPGFIKTPMTAALTEDQQKAILHAIPMSRIGDVEEIAEAVLFLAGDRSNYITGQVLSVNGGMAM